MAAVCLFTYLPSTKRCGRNNCKSLTRLYLNLRLPHERRNKTRMWPGFFKIKKAISLLPATIWLGNVGPEQAVLVNGKAA